MHRAIVSDETPNLFLLHYQLPKLTVENVLLIPHFAFTLSLLEKRKPLSTNARRAGWVGCNFLLDRIPADARIPIIQDAQPVSSSKVRKAYEKLRPLEKLNVQKRGWTLDVLRIVKGLNKKEFTLKEVYDQEDALAKLHPNNAHVRDKIRQQLQVLRDLGLPNSSASASIVFRSAALQGGIFLSLVFTRRLVWKPSAYELSGAPRVGFTRGCFYHAAPSH